MNDPRIPRRIIPERGQYVCPGSIFTPRQDGTCLCGLPRGAHYWAQSNGVLTRVSDAEHAAYLDDVLARGEGQR